MLEVDNKLYKQKLFATYSLMTDFFRSVEYSEFEGDIKTIPWFFHKENGSTCTQNLSIPLDEIFAQMKSNTRNEVRRAEKEGVWFEYNNDYVQFMNYYNHFAISKNLPVISLRSIDKYDKTIITIAKKGNEPLSMHATVINDKLQIAFLLYSCSMRLNEDVDKKLVGWANRYLHFKDFELFKEMGALRYEWSGVCTDPNQRDKYNIGVFKQSFGGVLRNRTTLSSPLFYAIATTKKILSKKKHLSKIIVNADDFGCSEDVNNGIVQAFKKNIITQTTLMVNMPFCDDAISLAKANGFLGKVGLHLNLDEGMPLTEDIKSISSLCMCDGFFIKNCIHLITRNRLFTREEKSAIQKEVSAQIEKFLGYSLPFMHIDSHHHIHTEIQMLNLLIPLAKNFVSMRISRNIFPNNYIFHIKILYKKLINIRISKYFKTTDYFGSYYDFHSSNKSKNGSFEIMVHPVLKNAILYDIVDREMIDMSTYQFIK